MPTKRHKQGLFICLDMLSCKICDETTYLYDNNLEQYMHIDDLFPPFFIQDRTFEYVNTTA